MDALDQTIQKNMALRKGAQGTEFDGAGGYRYRVNPDATVTILKDPSGRAEGAVLSAGKAYDAILAEYDKSQKAAAPGGAPAAGKATTGAPSSPAEPVASKLPVGAGLDKQSARPSFREMVSTGMTWEELASAAGGSPAPVEPAPDGPSKTGVPTMGHAELAAAAGAGQAKNVGPALNAARDQNNAAAAERERQATAASMPATINSHDDLVQAYNAAKARGAAPKK